MTIEVFRNLSAAGAWSSGPKVFRNINASGVWGGDPFVINSPIGYKIIRAPTGPMGQAANQDGGWAPLTAPFGSGEQIASLIQGHAANYVKLFAHTTSSVSQTQVFQIEQVRAGVTVATASFTLNPGDHDIEATIALSMLPGDYLILVMPNPADGTLLDLLVTVVSTP